MRNSLTSNGLEIQFIYNARNGFANSLFDFAHKIISPETYECNLCKITHGAFTENKKFKELKQKHNITLLHIDDYEKKYEKETSYPLIVLCDKSENEINRIETETINNINTVGELKDNIIKILF